MDRQLRNGYTTGTCATAAAKAAALFCVGAKREKSSEYLAEVSGEAAGSGEVKCRGVRETRAGNNGEKINAGSGDAKVRDTAEKDVRYCRVRICLAGGAEAEFEAERCALPESAAIPEYGRPDGPKEEQVVCPSDVWWRVRKDAGDDPDVTHGIWVYAAVAPITGEQRRQLIAEGTGYWSERFPGLYLDGGPGIGIATKEGLPCPRGHYAINPVPRDSIMAVVDQVCHEEGYRGCLRITVAAPEGTALAAATFNPRLGIEGGISILGTTGVVRPMSEDALRETIRLDIHVKAAEGCPVLLLSPGNYGETFLREKMGIPLGEAVTCSNFVAEAVRMAAADGFRKLLLAGHAGKLVKVSGGVPNTHSRYGDRRMEILEGLVREIPVRMSPPQREDLLRRIRCANTTDEAIGLLEEASLAEKALDRLAAGAKIYLQRWAAEDQQADSWKQNDGAAGFQAEVIVFSSGSGVLGRTGEADSFLRLWKSWKERK